MNAFANLPERTGFFEVLATTARSQVASMALASGQASGEYGNEHPRSDQILYVLSGDGFAELDGRRIELQPGMCLVIEVGEPHRIVGGESGLRTLNVYAPVAYPEGHD